MTAAKPRAGPPSYDAEKMRELVLHVARRSESDPFFGAVKLNKILFFADFFAYRAHGRPITGAEYGAHNLPENRPAPGSCISETVIVGTFFTGGGRAFDLSNPFQPREVAWAVPRPPRKSPARSIMLNDVFVDERGVLYTVDRLVGGLYIFELRV